MVDHAVRCHVERHQVVPSLCAGALGVSFDVERHQSGGTPLLMTHPALDSINQGTPAAEDHLAVWVTFMQRCGLFHSGKNEPDVQPLADAVGTQNRIKISPRRPSCQALVGTTSQSPLAPPQVCEHFGEAQCWFIGQLDRAHQCWIWGIFG
jgi:hypothetical protein